MSTIAQRRWDRETATVAALAACVSAIAFLTYFSRGEILLFGDAVAHINIARRVFDSRTPGLLQLGTVWLPLPHLLMIPFVVSRSLWMTGAGASFPSMAAYVFGVVGIFRLVRGVLAANASGQSKLIAAFAAGLYALNPNLLYLQSTAMTEPLYLAFFIWSIVHFNEYLQNRTEEAQNEQAKRSLVKCGLSVAAACLVRYDGWFLGAFLAAVVAILVATRRSVSNWRAPTQFLFLCGTVPILWFAYNAAVYRNPLEFATGPYSARAIERRTAVPGLPPHPGAGNLPVAALYFLKAGEHSVAEGNLQRVWLATALAGTLLFLWRDRRNRALLLLWIPLPFYMLSVAFGSVPIFTPTWWPFSYYNIRYGVQLLPALAVFFTLALHYGVSLVPSKPLKYGIGALGFLLAVASYGSVWRAQPASFREAWVNSRSRLQLERTLAQKLRELPPDATILMYLGEHVGTLQDAGIPLRRTINEGNHRVWKHPSDPQGLWEQSLMDPTKYTDFVVAFEGDVVWQAVHARALPVIAIISVNGQCTATIFRSH
jgi:hypothetical protein